MPTGGNTMTKTDATPSETRWTGDRLARAQLGVSSALGVIGIGTWLLAYFGPFPPHPWVFLTFAVIAVTCEIVATVIGVLNVGDREDWSWWAVAAVALAVLPAVGLSLEALVSAASGSSAA
jgi:ABC-type Na+ efflux pump permease subunit